MVEPFASDRHRRTPGTAAVASSSLADLHLLLVPTSDRPDPTERSDAPSVPRPPRGPEPSRRLPPPSFAPTFAAGYAEFRDAALGAPAVAASYLATIRTQADALALVWEAHVRGVATLPAVVAEVVRGALEAGVR